MSLRFLLLKSVAFLNCFLLLIFFSYNSVAFLYKSFIVMNESGYWYKIHAFINFIEKRGKDENQSYT